MHEVSTNSRGDRVIMAKIQVMKEPGVSVKGDETVDPEGMKE